MNISVPHLILSTALAIIAAVITALLAHYLKGREHKREFTINKSYPVHESLRDKLKDYFSDIAIKYDFQGYEGQNKKLLQDLVKRSHISFKEYRSQTNTEPLFSGWREVKLYDESLERFENEFLPDIVEIGKISTSKIRRLARQIEDLFTDYKKEETLLCDNLNEELGYETGTLTLIQKNYVHFRKDAYMGICWLKIFPLLKKLESHVEKFVAFE